MTGKAAEEDSVSLSVLQTSSELETSATDSRFIEFPGDDDKTRARKLSQSREYPSRVYLFPADDRYLPSLSAPTDGTKRGGCKSKSASRYCTYRTDAGS